MKPGISALVVAYNQVDLLSRCLESLSWTDEIVVLDVGSTEDVKSVAEKYHAQYHKLPYVSVVEEIRQKSLRYASHEYVLIVDADETVPAVLATTLREHLASSPAFVRIPRQNYVFGKWIRHSQWWPDYQMRLLNKSLVKWPRTLHAQPSVTGEGITLKPLPENSLRHENYSSLDQWFEKNRRYAKQEAAEILRSGDSFTFTGAVGKAVSQLTSRFFASEGYRDGTHGLMLSLLQFMYYFWVFAYFWEMKKYPEIAAESALVTYPSALFRHGFAETLYWGTKTAGPLTRLKAKLARKLLK